MINASEIMRAQLARSLGLDKYAEIMRGDPASPSFQRVFNGYYRIRRNEEWRNSYYALFLRARTEGLFDIVVEDEADDDSGNGE